MLEATFGARLRRRREEQSISLDTIAERTKIKASLFDELERGDASHWPSGIFRRSFMRAYAQVIGVNPDATVQEFLSLHPDPAETTSLWSAGAPDADTPPVDPTPTGRIRSILGLAVGPLSRARRTASHESAGPAEETPAPEPIRITAATEPAPAKVDFEAVAHLCTNLARVSSSQDVPALLEPVARLLSASGLIVWAWDGPSAALAPAFTYGYSDAVIARLPKVRRDADNLTAAALRSDLPCAIGSGAGMKGALAVPLPAPAGGESCGVLAIELERGGERSVGVRAAAEILAAQLARFVPARAAAMAKLSS